MINSVYIFGCVFSLLLNTQVDPLKSHLGYGYWKQAHTIVYEQPFDYAADKYLMQVLSGAGILAILHHRERTLSIIYSPIKFEKICKILSEHPKVQIKHIYFKTRQKELTCTTRYI